MCRVRAPVRMAVFDLDNTLLLSELMKRKTMREVVRRLDGGLDVLGSVPVDARCVPAGAPPPTRYTIFRDVALGLEARGALPASEGSAESLGVRLCDEFSRLVQERLASADEVPGASAMLGHLSACGLPCCVNSATPQAPLDDLVSALGWRQRFVRVLGMPADVPPGGAKVINLKIAAAERGATSAPLPPNLRPKPGCPAPTPARVIGRPRHNRRPGAVGDRPRGRRRQRLPRRARVRLRLHRRRSRRRRYLLGADARGGARHARRVR